MNTTPPETHGLHEAAVNRWLHDDQQWGPVPTWKPYPIMGPRPEFKDGRAKHLAEIAAKWEGAEGLA